MLWKSVASKRVIVPAPDLAAMMFFQAVSTSAPRGVTRPRPVTTTRRMTVKVDEHETGPSVMMRKNERDRERRSERGDRNDRGPRGGFDGE